MIPTFGNNRTVWENGIPQSGRGLPQSKTRSRPAAPFVSPRGFGLRQSSAALAGAVRFILKVGMSPKQRTIIIRQSAVWLPGISAAVVLFAERMGMFGQVLRLLPSGFGFGLGDLALFGGLFFLLVCSGWLTWDFLRHHGWWGHELIVLTIFATPVMVLVHGLWSFVVFLFMWLVAMLGMSIFDGF